MNLKVRDRVRLKDKFLHAQKGYEGIVVNVEQQSNPLVYFQDLNKRKLGHTGGGTYHKSGCYWVFGEALGSLTKIRDTKEQKEFEKLWV